MKYRIITMKHRDKQGNIVRSLETMKIVNYKKKKPDGSKDIIRRFEEK
jgi:hypothetical protein